MRIEDLDEDLEALFARVAEEAEFYHAGSVLQLPGDFSQLSNERRAIEHQEGWELRECIDGDLSASGDSYWCRVCGRDQPEPGEVCSGRRE